jgi:hypothetical protein
MFPATSALVVATAGLQVFVLSQVHMPEAWSRVLRLIHELRMFAIDSS